MAGKAKSNYLTVTDKNHVRVMHKVFFNIKELNALLKSEEFIETYPKDKFIIYKECY